jgi:hypothetical protein
VPRKLILLAVAAAATLALAGSARALTTDSYDGVAFYPFTIDPSNADCVPWNEPGVGTTRNCDPINIIFPGQQLATVVARLHATGWTDAGGSVQWLHFAYSTLVPVEWQLGYADGPDPTQRYHIRLWEAAPNLVIGNVHHEHGTPHKIDIPWDTAEAFLAAPLCASWCQRVELPEQSAIEDDSGMWRGFGNDAIATVIPTSPPPPVVTVVPKPRPKPHPKVRHKHRPHKHA